VARRDPRRWRISGLRHTRPQSLQRYHRYLAVLPRHRCNGYVNEILAEGTNVLARQDVPRIRASTDLANVPMALAFERAGWNNFERTINMTC
jgi:hypothetical protein